MKRNRGSGMAAGCANNGTARVNACAAAGGGKTFIEAILTLFGMEKWYTDFQSGRGI